MSVAEVVVYNFRILESLFPMLASVFFGGCSKTDFRKRLSFELIYNTYVPQQDEGQLRRSPRSESTQTYSLRGLPRGKKNLGFSSILSQNVLWLQKISPHILQLLSM